MNEEMQAALADLRTCNVVVMQTDGTTEAYAIEHASMFANLMHAYGVRGIEYLPHRIASQGVQQ